MLILSISLPDIIAIAVIVIIIGLASLYIYKAKKKGQKCIGCPFSKTCSSNKTCSGSCKCSKKNDSKDNL